jgi:SAM-dependent methyltransferase
MAAGAWYPMTTVDKLRDDWNEHFKQHVIDHPNQVYGYNWGGPTLMSNVAELYRRYLDGIDCVLELGCGGGKWTKWLFDEMHIKRVIALDIHELALATAKEYEPRAEYILGNGEVIPETVDAASINAVWTFDMFLHLPRELFAFYMRQLRGITPYVYFQLPNICYKDSLIGFRRQILERRWLNPFSLGYISYYTTGEVGMICKDAGYELHILGPIEDGNFVRDVAYGTY